MKPFKDIYDKDIMVDDNGFQVMMEWEKPYMKALVDHLSPTGDVLEIGFGFGYSADQIQSYDIKSHTIIECDKEVLKKAKSWARVQTNPVNIVEGYWQDNLSTLKTFDSIFFDDSPQEKYNDFENIRVYDFFYRVLKSHVNKNARMTWYLDAPIHWLAHPKTTWSLDQFKTDVPDNCEYVPEIDQDKGLYLPLVTFPYGRVENVNFIALDKYMNFIRGRKDLL